MQPFSGLYGLRYRSKPENLPAMSISPSVSPGAFLLASHPISRCASKSGTNNPHAAFFFLYSVFIFTIKLLLLARGESRSLASWCLSFIHSCIPSSLWLLMNEIVAIVALRCYVLCIISPFWYIYHLDREPVVLVIDLLFSNKLSTTMEVIACLENCMQFYFILKPESWVRI